MSSPKSGHKGDNGPSVGFWIVAFLCLAVAYQLFFGPKPGVKAGEAAPPLSLEQLSNAKRWTPQWKGKISVLEFWASHCSVCVSKLRSSSHRASRLQKSGTQHLMINIDAPTNLRSMRKYMMQQQVAKKLWHVHQRDAAYKSARAYRINVLPTIVIVNAKGEVAHYFQGTLSDSVLQAYIKQTRAAVSSLTPPQPRTLAIAALQGAVWGAPHKQMAALGIK